MTTVSDCAFSQAISESVPAPTGQGPASAPNPHFWKLRDFVILLSLVNLLYLRVWSELLGLKPADCFFLKRPFEASDYIAAMLDVLIIALALWVIVSVVRQHARGQFVTVLQFFFVILAVAGPGFAFRTVVMHETISSRIFGAHHYAPHAAVMLFEHLDRIAQTGASRRVAVVIGCFVLLLVVPYLKHTVRIVAALLLCSSPFVLVTFGQAGYAAVTRNFAVIPDQRLAPYVPVRSSTHVVWVVFDEWDYRLTFVDRDPTLKLDAIDGLRKESMFAENALSPAHNTMESLPSYIDGRRVQASRQDNAREMRITYADTGESAVWGTQPNLFSKLRANGVNVGMVGWYLPYCRIFGATLAQCSWVPRAIPANTTGNTLVQKLIGQLRSTFETANLSPFGQSLTQEQHARDYQQ